MQSRQKGLSQSAAAAKTGISVRSGRRIEKGQHTIAGERHWRTREDPLKAVWQSELVPLLSEDHSLTGVTLLEYLEDHHPGQYGNQHLRTLQRRVKLWLATEGPDKDVIFLQKAVPGRMGLSDFTHPNTPITINGEPFDHLLYQFRLGYSGWRSLKVTQGGESYSALADGLQRALRAIGGAPLEHRTDSLSAAYNNHINTWTDDYEALCQHYKMQPTRNNKGVSHENGAIEAPHGSFKRRLSQNLKLRKSTDFASVAAYQAFVDGVADRLNRRCLQRTQEEQERLQPLPQNHFMDYKEVTVCVTRSATMEVCRVLYTVPSRLKGERLRIHVYHDRLACFLGSQLIVTLPRAYPAAGKTRARQIDYRHMIVSLSAKPQAFRFSQLRDDLLPSEAYRRLWRHVDATLPARDACKWIVGVLRLAYDYDCEGELAWQLTQDMEQDQLPTLKQIQARYLPRRHTVTDIKTAQHQLVGYDRLLKSTDREVRHGRPD
jgi:transposase InsO family protein